MPWLRDLDGDGAVELIVWTGLSWGPSAPQTALLPVAYQVTDGALVRRDDLARVIAAPLAEVYRRTPSLRPDPACRQALVTALTR